MRALHRRLFGAVDPRLWLVHYLSVDNGLAAATAGLLSFVMFGVSAVAREEGGKLAHRGVSPVLLVGVAPSWPPRASRSARRLARIRGCCRNCRRIGFAVPYGIAIVQAQRPLSAEPTEPVALVSLIGTAIPVPLVPVVGRCSTTATARRSSSPWPRWWPSPGSSTYGRSRARSSRRAEPQASRPVSTGGGFLGWVRTPVTAAVACVVVFSLVVELVPGAAAPSRNDGSDAGARSTWPGRACTRRSEVLDRRAARSRGAAGAAGLALSVESRRRRSALPMPCGRGPRDRAPAVLPRGKTREGQVEGGHLRLWQRRGGDPTSADPRGGEEGR